MIILSNMSKKTVFIENKMEEITTLEMSIKALYQVFAKYPARRGMPYCQDCTKESDITKLFHRPLK